MSEHGNIIDKSDDWYTPAHVFEALGCRFDLDVAAPTGGPRYVPTCRWLSESGLERVWSGFVWMNPPFGHQSTKLAWLRKFIEHRNGIALLPDRTSAPWWQWAAPQMDALLFASPKIKFERPDGSIGEQPGSGTVLMDAWPDRCRSACARRGQGPGRLPPYQPHRSRSMTAPTPTEAEALVKRLEWLKEWIDRHDIGTTGAVVALGIALDAAAFIRSQQERVETAERGHAEALLRCAAWAGDFGRKCSEHQEALRRAEAAEARVKALSDAALETLEYLTVLFNDGTIDGQVGGAIIASLDAALSSAPAREDALAKAVGEQPAWRDVLAERRRQIEKEGWTPYHDDGHDKGEMAKAAACYALRSTGFKREALWKTLWPGGWSLQWFKEGQPRRMLVKAGALILAEIERLDRARAATPEKEESHERS